MGTVHWLEWRIECPECGSRFLFCRSRTPRMDHGGFETYSLECKRCCSPLAGIVDPSDETLLISQLER